MAKSTTIITKDTVTHKQIIDEYSRGVPIDAIAKWSEQRGYIGLDGEPKNTRAKPVVMEIIYNHLIANKKAGKSQSVERRTSP